MMKIPKWFNPIEKMSFNRTRNYNQNHMLVFCGDTGSGKSFSALEYARRIDIGDNGKTRFSIDRVALSAEQFMDLVKQKMPKGSVIIWDETGIGINARTFYNQQNLNISYITQTFRYKNYIVLYTTPSISYIDKQVRQLFHGYFEMKNIDYGNKISYARYFDIVHNPRSGDLRYPQIRRRNENGEKEIINKIGFRMPPKELVDEYEEKKKAHLEKLYSLYKNELAFGMDRTQKLDKNAIIEEVMNNQEDFTNNKGTIDGGFISIKFNIGKNAGHDIARYCNSKM